MMHSSYSEADVTILLKDITGLVQPLDTDTRERKIQSGIPYSEMLPIEYEPSAEYLRAYYDALDNFAEVTAQAVASLSEKIWSIRGESTVLVSLARAGTPVGILLKRYFGYRYGVNIPHYTLSIIRGVGIDHNAVDHVLERHPAGSIQFVDGWTGKGAIKGQLVAALAGRHDISPSLAVLSDPAGVSNLFGTREDFLIPSCCLNATVSGLMSRTFYRKDVIEENDFHGAVFYGELMDKDLSNAFIRRIEESFNLGPLKADEQIGGVLGREEVKEIAGVFDINNTNLIKPGIGEATRVLLRRVPWKLLVASLEDDKCLGHLYRLAREKGVEVVEYPLRNYKACGLIRAMSDI